MFLNNVTLLHSNNDTKKYIQILVNTATIVLIALNENDKIMTRADPDNFFRLA